MILIEPIKQIYSCYNNGICSHSVTRYSNVSIWMNEKPIRVEYAKLMQIRQVIYAPNILKITYNPQRMTSTIYEPSARI